MRRGVVVDLEKTVASIQRAVDEAERMAGIQVKGVYAGIAGDHIRSINSRGVIAVSRRDNEIGRADVDRVIEAAKAVIHKNFQSHIEAVNCHHNYVSKEHHFGEDVYVTRKGAVSAKAPRHGLRSSPGCGGALRVI